MKLFYLQEISKREVKGDSEKTKTDKNRARKEKKKRQSQAKKARELKAAEKAKKNPGSVDKKTVIEDLVKQSKTGKSVKIVQV